MEKLFLNGANVARINFSHGDHQLHYEYIKKIRQISQSLNNPITILQDIQGPKIRVGKFPENSKLLLENEVVYLTSNSTKKRNDIILVDFPNFCSYVKPGQIILLDDGNLELEAIDQKENEIIARVIVGGPLKSHKGINIPGVSINLPSLTEKDIADIQFGLKNDVDAIALSFVKSAQDITHARELIHQLDPSKRDIPIIAKLERPEALNNLEEIIKNSDGVMVARGDLGVEMPPEFVPIAQKMIIEKTNQNGKLVITATQMLDSMIVNPRPTRAEATDIANAIFDGSDSLMLSGETAIGDYPILSVKTMNDIIIQAECNISSWGRWCGSPTPQETGDDSYYITRAGYELSNDRNVAAIAVFTKSGGTALQVSKTRPQVHIWAFTPVKRVYHFLNMYWGVTPCLVPYISSIDDMLSMVEKNILTSKRYKPGQQIVLICGYPVNEIRSANLTLLHTLKNI